MALFKTVIFISKIILIIAPLLTLVGANASQVPTLPQPVANNAVAHVTANNETYLLSFMGLATGKGYQDVHNKAWALKVGEQSWQSISSVPSSITPKGRLAGVAVGINQYAYIFGGYTVDKAHNEISTPDVYRYDVIADKYHKLASMPVPVDDSVALVYQNRYIYLISGWHNDGNVNLVQVYDIKNNRWQQASPFLLAPVFGHAGAIAGDTMLVCDGVAVVPRKTERRTFKGLAQCLIGKISADNHLKIDWRLLAHPTGEARYRMAATGKGNKFYFIGGSNNPYNYEGIGYNGVPSPASDQIWIYDVLTKQWQLKRSAFKTMDHRGLIDLNGKLITVGGMNNQQQVIGSVTEHLTVN